MKAKVRATGQIVDVRVHGMKADGTPICFYTLDGRDYFKAEDLELESEKYETHDEWNKIYKDIEELCDRVTPLTTKYDAYYNEIWSAVRKNLISARGVLSADKDSSKW